MTDELLAAGLTRTESKIYTILVELGQSQAGLLSRRTGIHRRIVYDALERLIEKGLVSYIKENDKRIYIASDPERLHEIMQHLSAQVNLALPSLRAKYKEIKERPETIFYKGKEGIRAIFEDQLASKKPIFVIATAHKATEGLRYYIERYTSERIKRKIPLNIIYSNAKQGIKVPFAKTRYLPDSFASHVSTNIWAGKMAIIIWNYEPVAILINNKDVALTYKKYFDALWEIAQP